jgi:hypothetical protein
VGRIWAVIRDSDNAGVQIGGMKVAMDLNAVAKFDLRVQRREVASMELNRLKTEAAIEATIWARTKVIFELFFLLVRLMKLRC